MWIIFGFWFKQSLKNNETIGNIKNDWIFKDIFKRNNGIMIIF